MSMFSSVYNHLKLRIIVYLLTWNEPLTSTEAVGLGTGLSHFAPAYSSSSTLQTEERDEVQWMAWNWLQILTTVLKIILQFITYLPQVVYSQCWVGLLLFGHICLWPWSPHQFQWKWVGFYLWFPVLTVLKNDIKVHMKCKAERYLLLHIYTQHWVSM